MTVWRMVLPAKPIPWAWGFWSFMGEPSHYLAENERGEQAYVPRKMIDAHPQPGPSQ